MNVAILSSGRGWHTDALLGALESRGHDARLVPIHALRTGTHGSPRVLGGGLCVEDCDGVLVRLIPRGSLEQTIFRVDALHVLEKLGVVVLNPPAAIERTVDKFLTTQLLVEAGLKTPRTSVAEGFEAAMEAFLAMGDVIVKPLFGSNGRGMVRVTDEEIAHRVFRALEIERAVYYVQETIPHNGQDVRAFVIGDRVVAAAWRTSDGWRTNIARGGRAEGLELPPEWAEMSVVAARAVGADYAGVDLLPSRSGEVYVLEVNGIPGWRGLQGTTLVDIAATIVARLEERLERR
jgi:RimK family alpha-L-glutamate ligase